MSVQFYGKFDFQQQRFEPSEIVMQVRYGRCFVDGREIHLVWLADTEAGIVKTYDVLGDGNIYLGQDWDGPGGPDIDAPMDGIVSLTLRGKVELFAKEPEAPTEVQ